MANQRSAVLLACGSFNPPTNMHLRLFELAKDYLNSKGINVLGGIISPVNDGYEKKGLLPSNHRIKMVESALENYDFVKCSSWEADQEQWTRTRAVLDEYTKQISQAIQDSSKKPSWLPNINAEKNIPKLLLLCGGDLLETFSIPDLWKQEDILTIARDYGLVVITREGSNPEKYVYEHDILHKYKENIHLVVERVQNDISSTRIRRAVRRGESIRFLVPDPTIDYISKYKLYLPKEDEETNEYTENDACIIDTLANSDLSHECMLQKDVISQNKNTTNNIDIVPSCMMTTSQTFDIIDPIDLEPLLDVNLPLAIPDQITNDKASDTTLDNNTKLEKLCDQDNNPNTSTPPPSPSTTPVLDQTLENIETIDGISEKPELAQPYSTNQNAEEQPTSVTTSFEDIVNVSPSTNVIERDKKTDATQEDVLTENEMISSEVIAVTKVVDEDEDDCSCTTTGTRSPSEIHPVHFEITKQGVKVISDKESFL